MTNKIQLYYAVSDILAVCINITVSRSGAGEDQMILPHWPLGDLNEILCG